MEENSDAKKQAPKRPWGRTKRVSALVVILAVLLGGGVGGWMHLHRDNNPVPKTMLQSVSFPVYYPNQKKLPGGYMLDLSSFSSPQQGTILYSVKYDTNKKIIFSIQAKPSDSEIQNFYTNYIPLRNHLKISLGNVEIGAYGTSDNLKTVASLPTNDGSWLIATAPPDINQNQLEQVLNSLKK